MNRLGINPNNEKYYSKEFMQGYKCGIRCQSHEDMKVLEQIRAEIEHWESDDTQDDYQMGAMDMQKYILRVIDKYREEQTDAT